MNHIDKQFTGGAGEQLCFRSSGFAWKCFSSQGLFVFIMAFKMGEKFVHTSDEGDLFGYSLGEQLFVE